MKKYQTTLSDFKFIRFRDNQRVFVIEIRYDQILPQNGTKWSMHN